ncbi:MAG TPA: hypothetical protein VN081_06660 [Dongiaceae bacterium]|nr:hypothetical protein [Dongiaceae bacterium]
MPSLLTTLKVDYPTITFEESDQFSWSPDHQMVTYTLSDPHAPELLLHELSHGLLRHHDYQRDVELLGMERAAWDTACELAGTYAIAIDDDTIEDNLDTYREWLHARSTCPQCTATGYQINQTTYECPACLAQWRVNEARSCELRRYTTKGRDTLQNRVTTKKNPA